MLVSYDMGIEIGPPYPARRKIMNVLSMFDLKGEKAIVTGGGQGLGKEMTLALAEAGADIAIVQTPLDNSKKDGG